ncbi:MAG: redox-sensing transcriptional repressor Rex, partial [Clostridiales bacterium]|nr:redox-sensing transcriptional repressor Rex [Clostridiales bacterium]
MAGKNISMAVIRRLPKYYRYLGDLLDNDVQRISSKELSEIIGFTASQIRQDLNNFGGFGQQGYGYNIEALHTEIGKILGLDRPYNAILIGAGNLGQAIANYSGFRKAGFEIKGLFDANPKIIGLKIREFEILDSDKIEDFVKENKIDIGILCVPKNGAQELADRLNTKVCAALLGYDVKNLCEELIHHGADEVVCVDDENLDTYITSTYTKAFCEVIGKKDPDIVLVGATTIGRDLA